MIAIVAIAASICAVLPNATVVMLLVFVANSAGLLTLVGDPATFIAGNSIGLSFTEYLGLLSPGGLLALLGLVAILPLSFRSERCAQPRPR